MCQSNHSQILAAKIIIHNYGPLVWTPEVTMHKALKMALFTWFDATTIANQIYKFPLRKYGGCSNKGADTLKVQKHLQKLFKQDTKTLVYIDNLPKILETFSLLIFIYICNIYQLVFPTPTSREFPLQNGDFAGVQDINHFVNSPGGIPKYR